MSRADCYWPKSPSLSIWLMNPFSVVIGSFVALWSPSVFLRGLLSHKTSARKQTDRSGPPPPRRHVMHFDSSPGFSQWLLAQSQHTSRDPDLILAVIPAQMCRRWAWLLPSTFCISNKVKETHYKILHKMYPVYF